MLRFFRSTQELPRFESCCELNLLPPLVEQLHIRLKKLGEAAEKASDDSFENQKYILLAGYLGRIDKAIERFNNPEDILVDDELEKVNLLKDDMNKLVEDLKAIVSEIKDNGDLKILLTPRNLHRALVNGAINGGVTGGAIGVACFMPLTFPIGVLAIAAAEGGNTAVRHVTGLSDLRARSGRLVLELDNALHHTDLRLNPPMARPKH